MLAAGPTSAEEFELGKSVGKISRISAMAPKTETACASTARPKKRNVVMMMTIIAFLVTTEPGRRALLADTDTIL